MKKTRLFVNLTVLVLCFWGISNGICGDAKPLASGVTITLHPELKVEGSALKTYPHTESLEYAMGSIEGYPVSRKRLIRPYFNPFLLMLHVGFATHRPISISPDTIWLLICNGFSIHSNVFGVELQKKLFPGRKGITALVVRRDAFVKGENNQWESVFAEFSQQMEQHMANDVKSTLTDPFSTSSKADIAAFNITFMKTMSESFDFYVMTLCGIPSITLEGTPADWDAVARRTEKLRGYGCDWWLDQLKPVLYQFRQASRGKVDRDFWCSIYKEKERSGGSQCTGWCLNFFPYHKVKGKWLARRKQRPVSPSSLPVTLAWVPFQWIIGSGPRRTTYDMALQAGLVGVSVDKTTQTLRSEIGWGVVERKKKRRPRVENAAEDMYRDLKVTF